MSISIPRAFVNITEARVRKVFDELGIFSILRVDMVQRKNEKGDAYQRIFVHIKDWTETADAQKAREQLLAGKELKIIYDNPWFWKVLLNACPQKPKQKPSMYDRKPIARIDFGDQDVANKDAADSLMKSLDKKKEEFKAFVSNIPADINSDVLLGDIFEVAGCDVLAISNWSALHHSRNTYTAEIEFGDKESLNKAFRTNARGIKAVRGEDRRPYRERRVDPVYCQQDVKSGFNDRRPYRERRVDPVYCEQDVKSGFNDRRIAKPPIIIAKALPEFLEFPADKEEKKKEEKKVVIKEEKVAPKVAYQMDEEIVRLMTVFFKIGKSDITEELYKNNAQMIRDMRQSQIEEQEDTQESKEAKINYDGCGPAPKRKPRKIIQ